MADGVNGQCDAVADTYIAHQSGHKSLGGATNVTVMANPAATTPPFHSSYRAVLLTSFAIQGLAKANGNMMSYTIQLCCACLCKRCIPKGLALPC